MKNTALAKTNPNDVCELSQQDIQTLVSVGIIPAETPADVVVFFAKTCATMKMSPFKRQIHLIKRNAKVKKKQGNAWVEAYEPRYSIQVGIDGLRARADATGHYAGNDDYVFDNGLTQFQMIEAGFITPETATAKVYKIVGGVRCPFSATATWKSYCPAGDGESFMWRKMPFLMLGKTAEALALRKAFPNETSGVFTEEELAHVPIEFDEVTATSQETPIAHPRKTVKVESKPTAQTNPEPKPEPEKIQELKPEPTTDLPKVDNWRDTKITFGKHTGKKLSDLDDKSLRWFWQNIQVQETYEKDGKTVRCSESSIASQKLFRAALNAAGQEKEFVEEPTE